MSIVYGKQMRDRLKIAGVPVEKVTRKRATGHYLAEFYVPGLKDGVDSAAIYAGMIKSGLTNVRVINAHDTCAHWRDGQPVIMASVEFETLAATTHPPKVGSQTGEQHDEGSEATKRTQPAFAGQPPLPPIGIMTCISTPGPFHWWDRRGERFMTPAL